MKTLLSFVSMQILFVFFLFVCLGLSPLEASIASKKAPYNEEEALFVRRINEFWRDKELPFAKRQIEEFLSKFPKSEYADVFHAMLGEIASYEHNYEEGLKNFDNIKALEVR